MTTDHAPGALRIVEDFINTRNEDDDSVATPLELEGWFRDKGLVAAGESISTEDHRRAIALREGLRSMLMAHHGDVVDPAEVRQLNGLAAAIPLVAGFGPDGSLEVVPAIGGIDGALGTILAAALKGVAEGTWQRLKVCKMDTCRWAFFDASKNRSGTWCSMQVCGNRAKVRAYQQRKREKVSK